MKKVKISDIVEVFNGYAFDSDSFNSDGKGLPIIRIRDVVPGYSETFYSGEYPKEYLIDNGALLVGMDGEFNIEFWKGGKALLNQRVCQIIPKDSADILFLKYRLSLLLKRIEDGTPFVTVKHLSSEKLKDEEIELPPLTEQKRIASLLARADRLRTLRRTAHELGESLLQSVFLEMFGKVRGKTKEAKLGEISDIASGVTKGQNYNGRKTVEVPYLRVANVQDGYLDLSEIKTIQALPSEIEELRLQIGDVVMTEGGDFDKLGRGAIWRGEIENCIHQNHIFRVRLDKSKVTPEFFENYLLSPDAKKYFLTASKQTTNLASINMTQLKQLPVPLYPLSLQEEFAGVVARVESLRGRMSEAGRQVEGLFEALLSEAFNG